jgi:hypothetical protein
MVVSPKDRAGACRKERQGEKVSWPIKNTAKLAKYDNGGLLGSHDEQSARI